MLQHNLNWLFVLIILFKIIHGEEVAIYTYHPPEKYEGNIDENGVLLRDLHTNEIHQNVNLPTNFTSEDFSFVLFNWNNRHGVYISDKSTTKELRSVFNPSAGTKIIVHGWLSSANAEIVNNTIKVYLSKQNLNTIAVDWSTLAGYTNYPVTTYSVVPVGNGVAALVQRLLEAKVTTPKQLHLIGHSLGAHVMGVAGNKIKITTGKRVSRITGLDPAAPLYEILGGEASRLDPEDADFVDVIHTAIGAGYYNPLGHADFYPNGGRPSQPGCAKLLSTVVCSHSRAYKYYDESITNPKGFKSVECDSWDSYNNKSCDNNTNAYMGDPCPPSTRGIFYLSTNKEPPYARG